MPGEDAVDHGLPVGAQVQRNAHIRVLKDRLAFGKGDAAVVAGRIDEGLQPLLPIELVRD